MPQLPPQLVDSHCHLDRLDLSHFGDSLDNALTAAREEGVAQFLCVAINRENIPAVLAIAERYPDCFASVGFHPNDQEEQEPTVAELVELAAHPKVVAIGETGLDYFRSEGELSWQHQRFRNHIAAARVTRLPLIIHTRSASEDTLTIMREEGADRVGGVMHCFAEDWETAERALALGFYISFSGIVTYKSAESLREVAKRVPAERLLIETDAPYLAPVPHRGKGNHPAWVRHVAEMIAEVRGESYQQVADQTTANFRRLFLQSR